MNVQLVMVAVVKWCVLPELTPVVESDARMAFRNGNLVWSDECSGVETDVVAVECVVVARCNGDT